MQDQISSMSASAFTQLGWRFITGSEAGYWSEVNLCIAQVQTFLFGLAGIYLGLGSGFFNASLTRYGQQSDVGGMYATLLCLACLALCSWLPMLRIPKTCRILPSWPLLSVVVFLDSVYFTYYKWEYSLS